MKITTIDTRVHQLSVNVDNILFEGLWEIPKGVSINSYVVQGDAVALIDGVCGWDGVPESLFSLLDELEVDLKTIKYVVLNHLEPDHAGFVEALKVLHPDFTVVATHKGIELLHAFFGHDIETKEVKDGDTLDLGQGKVLSFYEIPNVHWPDTMVTYEAESKVLFSCDAFGSFGRIEGSAFDDDYTDAELAAMEHETLRYYSNIVGPFSPFVLKAIKKCEPLDLKVIAPGHGLMWRKRVEKIVADYIRYAHYQKGDVEDRVTLLWGSMYDNTKIAVDAAIKTLDALNIPYVSLQLPQTNWGDILTNVWQSKYVILAMPTYEYKMFPPMAAALEEIGKKKAHGRKAFSFGSYGWSGGAQKELDEIHDRYKMKWEFVPSHEFKGKPRSMDLEIIENRIKELILEN